MQEEDFQEEPLDPAVDRATRTLVLLILLFGGGYALLEFAHWLTHGGFRPFIVGSAFAAALIFFLVLWAKLLSRGVEVLRSKPFVISLCGLGTALGILVHHFLIA
ncbi:MAG: hypothetical protein Q7Q71_05340 [Verrucomicrobiota bacterium JB023]|nr:hypothetical protein [Verrucomicrobiota bacterium JB023]